MRLGQSAIGEWNDDDYDVLADGVVVGRIMNGARKHVVDVDARARSPHTATPRRARPPLRHSQKAGGGSEGAPMRVLC
jgi:hypothetical protein